MQESELIRLVQPNDHLQQAIRDTQSVKYLLLLHTIDVLQLQRYDSPVQLRHLSAQVVDLLGRSQPLGSADQPERVVVARRDRVVHGVVEFGARLDDRDFISDVVLFGLIVDAREAVLV